MGGEWFLQSAGDQRRGQSLAHVAELDTEAMRRACPGRDGIYTDQRIPDENGREGNRLAPNEGELRELWYAASRPPQRTRPSALGRG